MDEKKIDYCKCARFDTRRGSGATILRDLVKMGANKDWVSVEKILQNVDLDKVKIGFLLYWMHRCLNILEGKTATRAYTTSPKKFICLFDGRECWYVSHIKFTDDWMDKITNFEKQKRHE